MMGVTMPTVWYGVYTVGAVKIPVMLLFLVVGLAVLWPAAKAALIRPVDAMHHTG